MVGANLFAFLGNHAGNSTDFLGSFEIGADAKLGIGVQFSASVNLKVEKKCCLTLITVSSEAGVGAGIGLSGNFKVFNRRIGRSFNISGPSISKRTEHRVTIDCEGHVNGTGAFDIFRINWDHDYSFGIGLGFAAFSMSGGVDINGGVQVIVNANKYSVSARVEWNGEIGGHYKITGGYGENSEAVLKEGQSDDYYEHHKILFGPITYRF